MQICLVARSGGEYKPEHVDRLVEQIESHSPFNSIICLTDMPVTSCKALPMKYDWPGWWSKMMIFNPEIEGDLCYMDLDTTVIDDISDIVNIGTFAILRDFYRDGVRREEGMQSSLMYLPERMRQLTWNSWIEDGPGKVINYFNGFGLGDQAYLEKLWKGEASFYQDLVPNQIVSYKVHCKNKIVPPDARLIIHHGHPRPWDAGVKLNRNH